MACGGGDAASTSTSNQNNNQSSVIVEGRTYREGYRYRDSIDKEEKFVQENYDVVTYMKYVRFKEAKEKDVKLARSLAEIIAGNPIWGVAELGLFLKDNEDNILIPHTPLEDYLILLGTKDINQTKVPATRVAYQFKINGDWDSAVLVQDPDMTRIEFDEIKGRYSVQKPTTAPTQEFAAASPTQIEQWTREVLILAKDVKDQQEGDIILKMVDRILYAVEASNFEYEHLLAFLETCIEWSYGPLSEDVAIDHQNAVRESSKEWGERSNKHKITEDLKSYMGSDCLGEPEGWRIKE